MGHGYALTTIYIQMEDDIMARVTPAQFQEKHARRLKGAIEDMRTGINNVTQAPGAQAAKKADKMLANLTTAVTSGKWAANVGKVTLDEWKDKMLNKGLGRVATGIDAASAKVTAFAEKLLPAVDAAAAKVKSMPDLTIEDSINRVGTFIREMSKFKK